MSQLADYKSQSVDLSYRIKNQFHVLLLLYCWL